MSVQDRISNLEEGVKDTYNVLRAHVDDEARGILDELELEHIQLLRSAAFMEGKLRTQIQEALDE